MRCTQEMLSPRLGHVCTHEQCKKACDLLSTRGALWWNSGHTHTANLLGHLKCYQVYTDFKFYKTSSLSLRVD